MNNYNPWNNFMQFQNNNQIINPPTIGGIGFTNNNYINQNPYSYYNQQGNYNALYNQYYNPYLEQERIEREQKQLRQRQIEEISFRNKLNDMYYTYKGMEVEQLSPEEQLQEAEEYYEYLCEIQRINEEHSGFSMEGFYIVRWDSELCDYVKEQREREKEEKVDVEKWIDNMGYEYAKILTQKTIEQNRNLKNAYDSNSYQQLVNMHNNSNAPDALTRDFTIDDMEIKLPDSLKNEYSMRRKRFLDALMK